MALIPSAQQHERTKSSIIHYLPEVILCVMTALVWKHLQVGRLLNVYFCECATHISLIYIFKQGACWCTPGFL